mgnify:CR=1 FL=1
MKIKGKVVAETNIETVVIPRPSGPIVFKAQAVLDHKDFESLCPVPQPPGVLKPGGKKGFDYDDANYLDAQEKYAKRKFAWLVLQSLKATEGLEWETVDLGNPDTWLNYEQELRDSKFNETEIVYIVRAVLTANSLDEDKIESARQSFLAGQLAQVSE